MIIAEISANHLGSKARALDLIKAAAEAGADAVKLQTYKPGDMTLDCDAPDFIVQSPPWKGRSLYSLYKEAQTPWEWHADLFAHAALCGIHCFSSPFSVKAVSFLEGFRPPFYKIASFEITDLDLIQAADGTHRPLIISTGCATDDDIDAALDSIDGDTHVTLMHCVSSYPTPIAQANLPRIKYLQERFGCDVGISDHSLSTTLPALATALGATMVEKHLTLARSDGGPDAEFSLEPAEFKAMVETVREARLALQDCKTVSKLTTLKRSLYAVRDIKQGDVITRDNVRAIRPGNGLAPSALPIILGMRARQFAARGTAITLELVG